MIYLMYNIPDALQNRDLVLGLFLDFSKASELVVHDIFIR